MKPRTVLDLSIHGDEIEEERVRLERSLQKNELSFNDYSVEYPRHNSGPAPFDGSFIRKPTDINHTDFPWSYRSGDDLDDGVSPYSGNTVSTAGHHASALTLSAGLGGRKTARRRGSTVSAAEFDPDRPVNDMIGRADSKLSMFDLDLSKSKYMPAFDPVVVDNTAELDRVLQSGHLSRSGHLRSSHSSSASSSDSEAPRPSLSDALRHVSFSPKRPRNASPRATTTPLPERPRANNTTQLPERYSTRPSSPLVRSHMDEHNVPTPKPPKRPAAKPDVRLHPPTPSTSSSKHQRHDEPEHDVRPARWQTEERNPFHDIVNHSRQKAQPPNLSASRSRVQLPDVTGLTNAVESPARPLQQYHGYEPSGREVREAEARLISTLSAVQSRLHQLEDENSISRRRVRELEHELEMCKREVAEERTRILEQEHLISQQKKHVLRKGKGKEKAQEARLDDFDISVRYREVVEEKKALEALVTTLRAHLTRLTGELSTHQQLLLDLKALRESDVETLKRKSEEVDKLKTEVERLAGEVQVLKGVVEEGLKERRTTRETSREVSQVSQVSQLEYLTDPEQEEEVVEEELADEELADEEQIEEQIEEEQESDEEESDEEHEDEPFDPASIPGSSRENARLADKTMRTDHATLGSNSTPGKPFISEDELEHISAEVDERRSERSADSSPSQTRSYFNSGEHEREDVPSRRVPSPGPSRYASRPTAPTPAHASVGHRREDVHVDPSDVDMPFPKIRGAKLERLFYSARHNNKTCTMCQRRNRRPGGGAAEDGGRPLSPAWLPSRLGRVSSARRPQYHEDEDEDDEGFFEEPGSADEGERLLREARRGKKKLPPQTVLTRVIKEMEEDFAHYKSVYEELADQYKLMDAASDVPKRNLLAHHLREVIDIIERKGDQIASLYDLLEFKDKRIS